MCKAVPKEGLRAPLFYLGVVKLNLLCGFAFAQDVQQAELQRCASLATVEAKLECYEALTSAGGTEVDPAAADPASAPNASPESVVPDANGNTAGNVEDERAPPEIESPPDMQDSEPGAMSMADPVQAGVDAEAVVPAAVQEAASATPKSGEVAAGAATVPAARTATGGASEATPAVEDAVSEQGGIPDHFGSKHLGVPEDDDRDDVSVVATVVEVEKGPNKVLYFTFENGQVWRQIEGRRFSYPRNEAFEVVVSTGMMGDYRLRLAKGGPKTGIRRIR